MPIHLPHLKISEVGIRFQSLVSLVYLWVCCSHLPPLGQGLKSSLIEVSKHKKRLWIPVTGMRFKKSQICP